MPLEYNPLSLLGFDLTGSPTGNQLYALSGTVAPNIGLGVPAIDGQLYTNQTDDSLWIKHGPLNTDWVLESTAGSDLVSLNGLTTPNQTFNLTSTGTDITITSLGTVHTFDIPTASVTNTGKLSSTDWATFNAKLDANSTIDGGAWI
jgi:hypothetical protein